MSATDASDKQTSNEVNPFQFSVDWDEFMKPAIETVSALNQLIELVGQEEPYILYPEGESNDKFQVSVNVQQFGPNELEVKLVDDCVILEAKHEEKKDDQGEISRHFVTRYQLPEDVKPESVVCDLSSDGILTISAPRVAVEKKESGRKLPIRFTGKPAMLKNENCCKRVGGCIKQDNTPCPCELAKQRDSSQVTEKQKVEESK